jgi:hypothetical protein
LHYQLGKDAAAREYAREWLRMYGAVGNVNNEKGARESTHRDMKRLAGWG